MHVEMASESNFDSKSHLVLNFDLSCNSEPQP